VVRSPGAVRESIGLAGQSTAIQEELTGRENLDIMGRLYHLDAATRRSVGFRFHNGFAPALLMVVLGVMFGVVVCTVSAFVGLAIKDEESVGSFGLVWLFPLTFVSAAFVPVASMPGWLQGFAKNQPVTIVIDEMRALALGGPLGLHA
jgi:ABC-2 type transport system permease protein/oleandomycin transport system permease protein